MPSDSRNSTMAKATGLLFNVASAREVPFAIPLYMQCILHGPTTALLCVPFIFVHHVDCTWWLPFVTEIVCSGFFLNSCWFVLLNNGLNIAGNEASSFRLIDKCVSGARGAIVPMQYAWFTSNNKAVLLYIFQSF